mgnify:CR=1 FL=1
MVYGPHCEIFRFQLESCLIKETSKLNFSKDVYSILEYEGPTNNIFDEFRHFFKDESDEQVFKLVRTGFKGALLEYGKSGKPYLKIGNNDELIFSIPNFTKQIIGILGNYKIEVCLEDPKYSDWLKIKQYLPDGVFNGSDRERSLQYQKNIKQNEKTFREQIQRIANDYDKASFILIRGDLHMKYFSEILNDFKNDFEVSKATYGPLFT